MASVVFLDDNIRVNAKKGKTIRQITNAVGASLNFGCRVGDCGSCECRVLNGVEYLSPLSIKEKNYFEMLNVEDSERRLMCQCSVESDDGEIVIKYGV